MVNIARVEDKLVVISDITGVPVYDFDFDLHFCCTHPQSFRNEELCILRLGPTSEYEREFHEKAAWGLKLTNSPSEHARASELAVWYPRLVDLTPRTHVFTQLPLVDQVEALFKWLVFLKGSRQTSKHNPELSIITSASHYQQASEAYRSDPILHWQPPVIREFVPLLPVPGHVPTKIKPSLEFRSFWWSDRCIAWGEYWYQVPRYEAKDIDQGLLLVKSDLRHSTSAYSRFSYRVSSAARLATQRP